jgi:cytochrome c7-like protein
MKRALALALVAITLAAATAALSQSTLIPIGGGKGPQQPIAFSHQIHAGKLAMNCLYCHYGADKSPIANLPPVGVCMGCHKLAMTDRPEVQKLAAYWERGEVVPWVEVYRLPDHVKFNHKRHVKAGVQCAECHGQVDSMAVLVQYPSLKMGWCITCHRKKLNDPKFPATLDCVSCHH